MTGFQNVIHGIENFLHDSTAKALAFLAPVINGVKEHALHDAEIVIAQTVKDIAVAQQNGTAGKDLINVAVASVEKHALEQGKPLAAQALSTLTTVALAQAANIHPLDPSKLNQ